MLADAKDLWGKVDEALAILTARVSEIRPAPGQKLDDRETRSLASISRCYLRLIYQRNRAVALPERAWNILLDLFSSTVAGQTVSITDACIASDGPPTSALRYLKILERAELTTRFPDEKDGRRVYVALTVRGEEIARDFLTGLATL